MAEDVSSIVKESIDGLLQSQQFNAQKVCIALLLVERITVLSDIAQASA